jgi:hypothetical protein
MSQYQQHSLCSSTTAFCLLRSNPRSERARTGNVLPVTKEYRTRTTTKGRETSTNILPFFLVIYLFLDILSLINQWKSSRILRVFSILHSPHRSRMRSHVLLVADLIDPYRSPRCITQNMALARCFFIGRYRLDRIHCVACTTIRPLLSSRTTYALLSTLSATHK